MNICSRLGYLLQGSVELGIAGLCAVTAIQSSQDDYCLGGVYEKPLKFTFNQELTACGITHTTIRAGNMMSGFYSFVSGEKPFSMFSIPVSQISTFVSGGSAILFALAGIRDIGKAFGSSSHTHHTISHTHHTMPPTHVGNTL